MSDPASSLPFLLGLAWILPLCSFFVIVLCGKALGKSSAWLATGAIVSAFVLSFISLVIWLGNFPLDGKSEAETPASQSQEAGQAAATSASVLLVADHGHADSAHGENEHAQHGAAGHGAAGHGAAGHDAAGHDAAGHDAGHHGEKHIERVEAITGNWYDLARFGKLRISIGYYIDSLTVAMFCMVTLIASCIHFYAMGYMHEELHDMTDHEVTLANGEHLHRPGRYYRFFQYLSLFCFSMLGIVIAGSAAMTFVFWELVGICSYFLIGFYIERHSASTAANKAFIVNRVGDFGMIIGLMILFGTLGTFNYGDIADENGEVQPGIFSQIRTPENHHQLATPVGMVLASASDEIQVIQDEHPHDKASADSEIASRIDTWREEGYGYWLLVIAGLGIFCGCVGKSAQFPLHVWLPDAMEGPTPVSALVHSATMVAAGVFLVGRFFPAFAPEVLLTIAYIGLITLFMAATIAITATDIKRVLAYSTVSQLGYMMLALGLGGWIAGVLHLFTHAFFKSLLFMCSGSVIHAVHTNEMTEMGGLRKKMPWTAGTMLIGCLAIAGAGIPFLVGFSGYYSKDAILEHALLFGQKNPLHNILFFGAAGGAAITAFYMFRMWYMTFVGEPRDKHRYDHAHESPKVMVYPLIVLSFFAIAVAWDWVPGINSYVNLVDLLEQARPAGTAVEANNGMLLHDLTVPNEHDRHADAIVTQATLVAFGTAAAGFLLATVIYCWRKIDPDEIRNQFRGLHRFLVNKWWFDEIYNAIFIQPTHFIARRLSQVDLKILDGIIHFCAYAVRWISRIFDAVFDRFVVDGLVNMVARRTWNLGLSLRSIQTGQLRQYVMFIVIGTVALFALIGLYWTTAFAG